MIRLLFSACALIAAFTLASPTQAAPDQVLRWHGALEANGETASGAHDFQVLLYPQASGGAPLVPVMAFSAVSVDAQGRFTLDLPWNTMPLPVAGGWLQVAVRRTGAAGGMVVLSPRRYLASVPYAHHAETAQFAASVPNASIGSAQIIANQVQVRVADACPANTAMVQVSVNGTPQCRGYGLITGISASVGPGLITTPNFNGVAGRWLVSLTAGAIGGQHLANNAVTAPKLRAGAVTTARIADNAVGLAAIDPTSVQRRIFACGGTSHLGMDGVRQSGSGICRLDHLDGVNNNQVATDSDISRNAFVGGGASNDASHLRNFIGGGRENTADGQSATGLIGGGFRNQTNRDVLGGGYNVAESGSIPGGYGNCAASRGFAAGHRAKIRQDSLRDYHPDCPTVLNGDRGVFMWADSQAADFVSNEGGQFLVRAAGGIHFGTNSTVSLTSSRFISTSTGAYLTTGGIWTNASSRAWKTPFQPIDTRAILRGVMALPMATWEYIASPGEGRHLGPMAEDFAAAFNVGEATTISTTDSAGVALAAIQGLAAQSAEDFDALRARLAAENAALAGEIAELAAMVEALEQSVRK